MNFFGQPQKISQAEKELRPLLFDDGVQVLSSFELNKIASLTYGDLVCDEIFELIEQIISQPLNVTPLTLQKTLVVMRHVLIYGSAKCVNSGYGIGRFVENLIDFNTVLAAQQQQGVNAFFQRIQGGGVDRGGPVREVAQKIHGLLKNINDLQRIRNESASKNSLVPIGDDKIAFITDDVRHYILKKKIEQQEQIQIRSNLAKSEGGFGGGYMTKDGNHVVGAAHGIEEMLKMAQREKKRFTDDGISGGPSPEEKILMELAEEARRQKQESNRNTSIQAGDLLGSTSNGDDPSQEVDLLGFGDEVQQMPASSSSAAGDLLGDFGQQTSSSETNDFLGLGSSAPTAQNNDSLLQMNPWNTGMPTAQNADPFSSLAAVPSGGSSADGGLGGLNGAMNNLALGPSTTAFSTPKEDKFAALDALANSMPHSSLNAQMAENRLLGAGSTPSGGFSASGSGSLTSPTTGSYGTSTMGMPMGNHHIMTTPGSGKVAAAYGDGDNDESDPWVMGGLTGTGLQPMGAAPAAPPPPPPPDQ